MQCTAQLRCPPARSPRSGALGWLSTQWDVEWLSFSRKPRTAAWCRAEAGLGRMPLATAVLQQAATHGPRAAGSACGPRSSGHPPGRVGAPPPQARGAGRPRSSVLDSKEWSLSPTPMRRPRWKSKSERNLLACGVAASLQRRQRRPQQPCTSSCHSSAKADDTDGVVLTAKLATRLLAELLEAYRISPCVEDAHTIVGGRWGFGSAAQMTRCIEAQANASYCCTNLPMAAS